MLDQVELCNAAIGHLGQGQLIQDFDNEDSAEAEACRTFYEIVRRSVLREFDWPCARRYATATLVEADPLDEWAYSYRYPAAALAVRRIVSGMRVDPRYSEVEYMIGSDATGKLIYTDHDAPILQYTNNLTDTTQFDADLDDAFALRLAKYIAPKICGNDKSSVIARVEAEYRDVLSQARANALNEQRLNTNQDAELINERS